MGSAKDVILKGIVVRELWDWLGGSRALPGGHAHDWNQLARGLL
jgi:hypothetical protein